MVRACIRLAKKYKAFVKYCIVGGTGTVVDVTLLYLLVEFAGFAVLPAAFCSFVGGAINNYTWNKMWTFRVKSKKHHVLFSKFFLVATTGLVLTLLLMHLFVDLLGIWYILAKLITSALVLVWNFTVNKHWTFKGHFSP